jgi:ankyrin repeat protein
LRIQVNIRPTESVQRLNYGPDVDTNTPDEEGWTPLNSASSSGHKEVVELLLAHPGEDSHQLRACRGLIIDQVLMPIHQTRMMDTSEFGISQRTQRRSRAAACASRRIFSPTESLHKLNCPRTIYESTVLDAYILGLPRQMAIK